MDWTWRQRLRFFLTGALLTALATLAPVAHTIWYWLANWNDTPFDKKYLWQLAVSCAAVPVYQYYREHVALLKPPPGLILPPEFAPTLKSKSVAVESQVVQTASGQPMLVTETTTKEKKSQPIELTGDTPLNPPADTKKTDV